MKKLLFLIAIFSGLKANAQNYFISFTGTGESTTVSTIKVENLDAGTSLILRGNQILHLTSIITGFRSAENIQSGIKIYPNPMFESSVLQIYPPEDGIAVIKVSDMSGKLVAQIQSHLDNTLQEFRLSGINTGFYVITVKGNDYQYSGKLMCSGKADGSVRIEKISSNLVAEVKTSETGAKGIQTSVDMRYSTGDTLKFTGISENYTTVMTDIPEFDKTIALNFLDCVDGDNNIYPVVQIGTQFWMAENLKTTKYSDGTNIPLINTQATWDSLKLPDKAYSWYNDDLTMKNTYGALYTWAGAMNGSIKSKTSPRDIQGACPTGWHIPGVNEWDTLVAYLGGRGNASRRLQEAGTGHWINPDPLVTNKSGFTGLPGGFRLLNGTFLQIGTGGYWWSTDLLSSFTWSWFYYMPFVLGGLDFMSQTNGLSVRCLKDSYQSSTVATVSTSQVSAITDSFATSGGDISSDGGTNITARGVCWGTSAKPTISDNFISNGNGTGLYNCNISIKGLAAGTRYYIRAYATNINGTSYGNELFFTTRGETGTVLDIDGNTYSTVAIGTQTWMSENLRTTKFNDGTPIPLVTDGTAWTALTASAYCWFNNNEASYKNAYGALYNWYSVNTGKLCPSGWHMPNDSEWTSLSTYLGGTSVTGAKLKETGAAHWQSPDTETICTNESGFTALPGSYRYDNGSFDNAVGYNGYWWTATENDPSNSWIRYMVFNSTDLSRYSGSKKYGFSVRCVKD